jgi:hypothetical protein
MIPIRTVRLLTNEKRFARRFASTVTEGQKQKQKLVVLGSGWGGYNVAR